MPASDADPLTANNDVPPELMSMCTRLPRLPKAGEFRVKLPRVSVPPVSGEIVPELARTAPVKVPVPLSVPRCALKPEFLQTETGA